MHAQVDEERAALERANCALRGGDASAGEHLLVLLVCCALILNSQFWFVW